MSILPIFRTQRGNSYEPFTSSSSVTDHTYNYHKYTTPNNNNYNYVRHETAAIAANHPHPQQRILSPHHHHNHNANNYNKGFMGNSRIEWRECPDAYIIRTELPAGIRREDVKVTIVEEERLLKITGVIRNNYKEEDMMSYDDHYNNNNNNNNNHHHVERGKFMTAFVLPEDVSPDHVNITMDNNNNNNGVLNVTLPKRSMPKYHLPPVEIVL